jgi:hypothetical protein
VVTHRSSSQGEYLAPTTLGHLLDPPTSASAVNRLLEERGFQVRDGLNWRPTPSGEAYSVTEVMPYRNRDGTAKIAVRWKAIVLELLTRSSVPASGGPPRVTA